MTSGGRSDLGSEFADVGVVLVEFHSGGRVADVAIRALNAGLSVCVTDNSGTYSGPGRVVRAGTNLGFGAACNRAVEVLPASVEIVVFHNPDLSARTEVLANLAEIVRSGEADAVAPTIVGAVRRPVGFRYPAAWREPALVMADLVRVRRRPAAERAPTRAAAATSAHLVRSRGRFGTAALLVVNRSVFCEVGGFDERFFLYGEDLDLWHRFARGGHDVGFAPWLEAHHDEGQGSAGGVTSRTVLRWLSRELFAELHGGSWRWYRLVHRLATRFLPDDDTVRAVRSAFEESRAPAETIAAARWGQTPVGWS